MPSATMASLSILLLSVSFGVLASAFYEGRSPVESLSPTDFDRKVISDDGGFWLVEFYANWCGHCRSLVPEWEKAAAGLKGVINVGAVDADTHKELAEEYKIKGFPTIKLFAPGPGAKPKVVSYTGNRTAKDIVEWALGEARKLILNRISVSGGSNSGSGRKAPSPSGGGGFYAGSDVVALDDANFEEEVLEHDGPVMVEFFAPWCGHCKNLKGPYEELAKSMRGKSKVAAVDCTANEAVCQRYDVKGYPTLKFFGASAGGPEDYNGGRDLGSLEAFLLEKWAAIQPPPQVAQLTGQDVFESGCLGHDAAPAKKLCLLAFLPDLIDSGAAGRSASIQLLQEVADAHKDRPFGFLWAEGGSQPALEQSLEVGGFGYPALAALNPAEQKFALLREAFELQHVAQFLDRLRRGAERAISVQGSLPVVLDVAAWDGEDAVLDDVEEISLEDLMSDEL